jgi:hypothetical protein
MENPVSIDNLLVALFPGTRRASNLRPEIFDKTQKAFEEEFCGPMLRALSKEPVKEKREGE